MRPLRYACALMALGVAILPVWAQPSAGGQWIAATTGPRGDQPTCVEHRVRESTQSSAGSEVLRIEARNRCDVPMQVVLMGITTQPGGWEISYFDNSHFFVGDELPAGATSMLSLDHAGNNGQRFKGYAVHALDRRRSAMATSVTGCGSRGKGHCPALLPYPTVAVNDVVAKTAEQDVAQRHDEKIAELRRRSDALTPGPAGASPPKDTPPVGRPSAETVARLAAAVPARPLPAGAPRAAEIWLANMMHQSPAGVTLHIDGSRSYGELRMRTRIIRFYGCLRQSANRFTCSYRAREDFMKGDAVIPRAAWLGDGENDMEDVLVRNARGEWVTERSTIKLTEAERERIQENLDIGACNARRIWLNCDKNPWNAGCDC